MCLTEDERSCYMSVQDTKARKLLFVRLATCSRDRVCDHGIVGESNTYRIETARDVNKSRQTKSLAELSAVEQFNCGLPYNIHPLPSLF